MNKNELKKLFIDWLKKNIIVTSLFVILLIVTLGLNIVQSKPSPEKTLLTYAKAVTSQKVKDLEKVMENPESVQLDYMFQSLYEMSEKISLKIYPGSVIFNEDETEASVNCCQVITYLENETLVDLEFINYTLVKIDNQWLIRE